MKQGVLVYNHFLKLESYLRNIRLFMQGCQQAGLLVELKSNAELACIVNSGFISRFPYQFAIFLDKDILLAQALEQNGVRVYNSSNAIRICDHKGLTQIQLAGSSIPMPLTYCGPFSYSNIGYSDLSFLQKESFPFPVVVKECYGSLGQQVSLAHDKTQLEQIVTRLSPAPFLIQEYLPDTDGSDIRLFVIGGKCVAGMKRTNPSDFRANTEQGGCCIPYQFTDKEAETAQKVCQIIGLDFAGIDFIYSRGTHYFIEANSNAMVHNLMECTGINLPFLIAQMIRDDQNL